jgi:hypothetical protein
MEGKRSGIELMPYVWIVPMQRDGVAELTVSQ